MQNPQMYTQDDLKQLLRKAIGKRPSHIPESPVQPKFEPKFEPKAEKLPAVESEVSGTLSLELEEEKRKAEILKEAESEKAKPPIPEMAEKRLTSSEDQEAKARLVRLIQDKKELEDKVTSLSCEKATLTAKLQAVLRQVTTHEEDHLELSKKMQEVALVLIQKTEELDLVETTYSKEKETSASLLSENSALTLRLEEIEETLNETRSERKSIEEQKEDLQRALEEAKTNYSQEIAVARSCLIERSSSLDDIQSKYRLLSQEHLFAQKRVDEQENHLRLLEQHLARRVKECSLLSKQIEEQMDRISLLQNSVGEQERKVKNLESNLSDAAKAEESARRTHSDELLRLKDQIAKLDQILTERDRQIERQEEELAHCHECLVRFDQVEKLLKQIPDILQHVPELDLKPPVPAKPLPAQTEQTDFISRHSSPKPSRQSLFE